MKHLGFITTIIISFIIFAVAGGVLLNVAFSNENKSPTYSSVDISHILSNSSLDLNLDNRPNNTPVTNITNSYNILLLVPDVASGCTDTIIILNFCPEEGRISTLSIPRDTCVMMPNGSWDKINSVYARYGIDKLCSTIKQVTAIDINYYFVLDIATVRAVIDYLDGVYYNLPVDLYYVDQAQDLYIDLKAGFQLFDGYKAEQLLRFRGYNDWYHPTAEQLSYYGGSDMNRIRTQISFMKETFIQKFTLKYLTNINSILTVFMENTDTNISTDMIMSILADTIDSYDGSIDFANNMFSFYLGGETEYRYSDNYEKDIYFWIPNDTICSSEDKVYSIDNIVMLLFLNDKESISAK